MPETVRATFDQLRRFLKWDITRILEHKDVGNYAIAVLVAIGSEALSRLQGLRVQHVFVGMMTKHGLTPEMAGDVFSALRNGVAHTYDTHYIQSGDLRIELIISRSKYKHATVRREPAGIVLDDETLWEDLDQVIQTLNRTLPPGGALPSDWLKDMVKKGDERAVVAWRNWMNTAEDARIE